MPPMDPLDALEQQLVNNGYRRRVGSDHGMTFKQIRDVEVGFIQVCTALARQQTQERVEISQQHGVEAETRREYAAIHKEMPAMSEEYEAASEKVKTTARKLAKETEELKKWTEIRNQHQKDIATVLGRRASRGEASTQEERDIQALFVSGREYSVSKGTIAGQFGTEQGAISKTFGPTTKFELHRTGLGDPTARISDTSAAYTMLQMSRGSA
ncbi:hypothetical protein K491DRAFT_713028 [Lophiostoma macrostomum CBS 122681]|uniref:Uncharacterized protein n=1 Tax=Lophiostoma macrostomum CBS 122681 TaxID=1314788 RepID=A0A6A6TGB0_9PLEO|nr:hypothetical protein K491DRAFT_713028 [Lophiostoma macrostomum CBS 122681]